QPQPLRSMANTISSANHAPAPAFPNESMNVMKYASPDPKEKINWLSSMPFFGFHALAAAALLIGVDRASLLLCSVLYFVRMFFITAGYHRYFSHRSFKTGRTMQFLLALGGTTAVQKSPLWSAAYRRTHHIYSRAYRVNP